LAAGAAHVVGHASASLHVLVTPARPYLPQPTFLCAYKPASAVPVRTRVSTRAAVVRHCRRKVRTIFQSLSSRTQELQPFPVHYNTSPSCLLLKPSHPFAGTRVPAAAAGPPPSSSLLRHFSKPVTCLAPSLGHLETPRAARGAQASPSPPSSFPRARRRCSAVAARRSLPRSIHHRQSVTGESNRRSLSHVCVAEPHLAAGELVPAVGPEGEGLRVYL
jgi:hypothetical protein